MFLLYVLKSMKRRCEQEFATKQQEQIQIDPQAAKPFRRFSRRPSVRVQACIRDKSAFLFPALQKGRYNGHPY